MLAETGEETGTWLAQFRPYLCTVNHDKPPPTGFGKIKIFKSWQILQKTPQT
jgi:hypothetical protein